MSATRKQKGKRSGFRGRLVHSCLGILWIVIAVWSLASGWEYYRLGLEDSAYSELHEFYKPSGLIGHGFGIIGSLFMIIGISAYSIRKRCARFHSSGKLRSWLTFHIFLCTLGPYLVVLHTAFRFGGLISIALWSMLLVVVSGIFGRYVYIHIPKTVDGEFLTPQMLRSREYSLIESIEKTFQISPADVSRMLATSGVRATGTVWAALKVTVQLDIHRRRLPHRFNDRLMEIGLNEADRESVVGLLMDAVRIQQSAAVLLPFKRIFGYWHVFHMPLAAIMLLIMILHVGVAITFGYYWIV